MFKKISLLVIIASLLGLGFIITLTQTSYAVVTSDWKAGNIIDDSIFTDTESMNVSQIQDFLNYKVGTGTNGVPGQCDTNGIRTSELGGGTRAQYGAAHDNPVPFTCLKDFYEVPKTVPGSGVPANNYGGKPIPAGAKSAAQLIWDAAQKYDISPKVLLVKLGTESAGPLTSDDWPFLRQYTYAMGSHCPDSGPNGSANCDSDYAGFSIQMDSAASLLRWYLDSMSQPWWSYKKPYQNNSILWNIVESGCGAADVFIENKATAALYTYTPYQPNQAALNNMYGTGDGCSAYGNRNFWRTYNDWFGSTMAINGSITISKGLTIDKSPIYVGDTITASYKVSNSANYNIQAGGLGVCARLNGINYDFGYNPQVTIPANSEITITYSKKMTQPGGMEVLICSYLPQVGRWTSDIYPYNINKLIRTISSKVQDNPLITTSVATNPTHPIAGQTVTATFTVTNASSSSVDVGALIVAARDPSGKNVDFPLTENVVIAANSTYTYSKSRVLAVPGSYTLFVSRFKDGAWNANYLKAAVGINKLITVQVQE